MVFKSFIWKPEYFDSVVVLSTFIVGYFLYWFLSNSSLLVSFCKKNFGGEKTQSVNILLQRLIGTVFLGILPVSVVLGILPENLSDFGIKPLKSIFVIYWILGIYAILIPLIISSSRKPGFYSIYPLIRQKKWNRKLIISNTVSWGIYLLAYEFLFRGFLLFGCMRSFGSWPSILINVSLYFCVHIPYGFWVSLGSIPLGIALCIASIHTGTIWVAFFVHLLVALLNDYTALRTNPEMSVEKKAAH